jgi:D-alanyl-D-alanine carboxypeptidase
MKLIKQVIWLRIANLGIILVAIFCSFGVLFWFKPGIAHSPSIIKQYISTVTLVQVPNNSKIATEPSGFSITDTSSMWVIVNKQHPLSPLNFTPNDLVKTHGATIRSFAESDFVALMTDSAKQGVNLTTTSSYRSYLYQRNLYNNYVAIHGQTDADTFSAKPGYSEHQTGLAIDFGSSSVVRCNLGSCFGQTKESQWLTANAYKYGYILRYPANKQTVTGYIAEAWHYRYVGCKLATEMKDKSIITLEEFFNINGGVVYK